jgi:hypothetical protein
MGKVISQFAVPLVVLLRGICFAAGPAIGTISGSGKVSDGFTVYAAAAPAIGLTAAAQSKGPF